MDDQHDVNDLGMSIENLDDVGTPPAPLYFEVESEGTEFNQSQLFASDEQGDGSRFSGKITGGSPSYTVDTSTGDLVIEEVQPDQLTASDSDVAGFGEVKMEAVRLSPDNGIEHEEEITVQEEEKNDEVFVETGDSVDSIGISSPSGDTADLVIDTEDAKGNNDEVSDSVDSVEISSPSGDTADLVTDTEDTKGNNDERSDNVGSSVTVGVDDTGIEFEVKSHGENAENSTGNGDISGIGEHVMADKDNVIPNGNGKDVEPYPFVDIDSSCCDRETAQLQQEDMIQDGAKCTKETIVEQGQPLEDTKKISSQQVPVVSSTPSKETAMESISNPVASRLSNMDFSFPGEQEGIIYESPIPPETHEGYASVTKKGDGKDTTLSSEVSSTDLNDTMEMVRDHYRTLPLPHSPWHSFNRDEARSVAATPPPLDLKNYTPLIVENERETSLTGSFASGIGLKDYEHDLSFGFVPASKKTDGDGQYTSLVAHSKREADARKEVLLKPCYVVSIGVGHIDFRKPSKRGSKTAEFFRSLASGTPQAEPMLIAWKIS